MLKQGVWRVVCWLRRFPFSEVHAFYSLSVPLPRSRDALTALSKHLNSEGKEEREQASKINGTLEKLVIDATSLKQKGYEEVLKRREVENSAMEQVREGLDKKDWTRPEKLLTILALALEREDSTLSATMRI
ncbi:hypothetical protein RJT34_31170 [Clitoria ternatea]|uniref:Uncharacterized protein n=1 Tax=Clitoria ternatea TaxID=43366 RepID=A0AAN9EUU5_CLITE